MRRLIPRVRGRAVIAAASLVVVAVAPKHLTAQTYWRVPGALGGAFVGAGVGWAVDIAAWGAGDLGGPDLNMTPIGIGVGGVLGFLGGLSADRRLARGESLTRPTRVALRAATFLAPVAAGSAIAFAIINPSDETGDEGGSDEAVALVAIGGGVVVGYLAQRRFARALHPRVRVGLAPDGRGVMVSMPLR
jgi:hypothetical protein